MDVAALIIAIVALVLALIVSGFGMFLQWLMFKANTEQVARMGEQNAALGERLTSALTEIHTITAHTRGTLDTTIRDVIRAALPKVAAKIETEPEAGELVAPLEEDEAARKSWQRKGLIAMVRGRPWAVRLFRLLRSEPEGVYFEALNNEVPPYEDKGWKEFQQDVYRGIIAARFLGHVEALGVITRKGDSILLDQDIDVDSILSEADQS